MAALLSGCTSRDNQQKMYPRGQQLLSSQRVRLRPGEAHFEIILENLYFTQQNALEAINAYKTLKM